MLSSYQVCFTIAAAKATTLCHTRMRGSHPLPDQLPGNIQVHITFCTVYLVTIALIAATHIHTFTHVR